MQTKTLSMREFALLGATIRLQELSDEVQAIRAQFPELQGQKPGAAKRGRRKLSVAERRAISLRMKASWAKRKSQ